MIADKKRKLLPGGAFDALIPRSTGKTAILGNGATTDHTIKTVQSVVRSTLDQTARLAPLLKGRDLRDTCSKIWHFVYDHIQYKNDEPGYEQVRHPARIWADRKRGVDCDDYTTIVSSILLNLGIPHKLRVTDYGRGWQHIYVVVPRSGQVTEKLDQDRRDDYIVIDCVPNDFDYEVHYAQKMDIPMQLQVLSGLNGVNTGPDYGIDGLAGNIGYDPHDPELGNIFHKLGGALKKAGNAVAKVTKKIVASPVRAGVLVFLKLNIKQSAAKLRWGYLPAYNQAMANAGYGPKAWEQFRDKLRKLQNTYVTLGGRPDALRGAILNSPGNKDKAVPVDSADLAGLGYLAEVDPDWAVASQIHSLESPVPMVEGLEGLRPNGIGALPAAVALVAAATPIVVPILNMIAHVKPNDDADPVPDEYLPDDDGPAADAQPEPTQPDPAVEGLGAVARKKAKKVAAVVARKKPKLVAKATATTVQRAGGTPVTNPVPKVAVKPSVATPAQKQAHIQAVKKKKKKKGATAAAVAAGAATVAVVAPIVRPVTVPESKLPSLPQSLPTVTDESGAEQVVMPTVVAPSVATPVAKAAKKQGIIARIFKKKAAKTAKPAASAKPAPAAAKQGAKPAGKAVTAPVRVAPAVSPDVDDYDTDAASAASISPEAVTDAIAQSAAAASKVVKNEKVARVLQKTGKAGAAVSQVIRAGQDAGGSVVDATAETQAQAEQDAYDAANVSSDKVPVPTGDGGANKAGFFTDSAGKPNWVNIGIVGVGAVMLKSLLFESDAAPGHRSPRKPKSLSGTPATGRKRKKRARGLAGLEAVELS